MDCNFAKVLLLDTILNKVSKGRKKERGNRDKGLFLLQSLFIFSTDHPLFQQLETG